MTAALPTRPALPHPGEGERASQALRRIALSATSERIALGALLDGLGERAFGLVLLVLALPCAIPFLYGVPQVVSIPMLFVAGQVALGRRTLWLPESLRARAFSTADFVRMVERAEPWLTRLELLARPRLSVLSGPVFERAFGLAMLVASVSIALPLPLTNTVPGIGVAIMALGLVERDGLLLLAGAAVALVWIGFLAFAGTTVVAFLLSLL